MNRAHRFGVLAALMGLAFAVSVAIVQPAVAAMPSGTMVLNGGRAYTRSLSVAVDSSVIGATSMRFGTANGAVWVWTEWRSYAAASAMSLLAPDGLKSVVAEYSDGAGHVFRTPYAHVTLDRVAPSGTMGVNGGKALTKSLSITVNSSVAGATLMRFGTVRDAAWVWTGWKKYAVSSAAGLFPPDGRKAVCADYADAAGNIFRTPYAYVTLDSTPPSGSFVIDGDQPYTRSAIARLTSSVSDAAIMRFGTVKDGKWVWTGWKTYAPSSSATMYGQDGNKLVCADYADAAGNVFRPPYGHILLDRTAPTIQSLVSLTHGNSTSWFNNDRVVFEWSPRSDLSGVDGYSFLLDHQALTTPDKTVDATPLGAHLAEFLSRADGKWVFHLRARDRIGNWGPAVHCAVRIDTGPPVTRQSGADGATHSRPVTVRFTASDGGGSGVKLTQYTIDGGAWTAGTKLVVPAPLDRQLTHTIQYRSVDNRGFIESAKSCTVRIDTIDRDAPTVRGIVAQHFAATHGQTAAIPCKITDPWPSCGWAKVSISLTNSAKVVVRSYKLGRIALNRSVSLRFPAGKAGYYGLHVVATDFKGHASADAHGYLRVK